MSDLITCHGMVSHPLDEPCEECEEVKRQFEAEVKKAGGKRKFLKKLREELKTK